MSNIIFTIVAKNYFASAELLAKSLMISNKNYKFFIVLADEISDELLDRAPIGYELIVAKDLPIEKFKKMAFKYDVTEFATSIKPYCIDYFLNAMSVQNVIYIDPDIYVYQPLDYIYELLNKYSAVVTPHILTCNNSSYDIEKNLLLNGTYNLGFFAVNNTKEGRTIIKWWKNKLSDAAYVDYLNGLYTDQKWMNLVTTEFENVFVLRDFAYNVAWWNFKERNITQIDGIPYVTQKGCTKPVVFFHFSGFKPKRMETISKSENYLELENKEEIKKVFLKYESCLLEQNYEELSKMSYAYNSYDNGIIITRFQRRLFRAIDETEYICSDPFLVTEKSFYALLKRNHLLVNTKDTAVIFVTRDNIPGFSHREKMVKSLLKMIKNMLGIRKYEVLIRYLSHSLEVEKQLFLINHTDKEK